MDGSLDVADWWRRLPPERSRNWTVILLGGYGQDVFDKLDNGIDVGVFCVWEGHGGTLEDLGR